MIDILKIIVILYMILVVPVMTGVLWDTCITRRVFSMETFVRGWFCMMALFLCEAVPMIMGRASLSALKNVWLFTVIIITLSNIVMLFRGKVEPAKLLRIINRKYVVIAGVLVLCSVLFLKPDMDDSTVETVMEAYSTDTMYQYQPYTDDEYSTIPKENVSAPIEMYYAVLADMVGAHPAIVVRLLIPIAFLNVFMLVQIMWARLLFGKNSRFRRIFLLFVGLIYFLPVISTNMEYLEIWQNCWKGEVMLGTTVLPLVCYDVYCLIVSLSEQWDRKKYIGYGRKLLISAMAGQLLYVKGMALSLIIVSSGVLIIVVRRWYEKYVANDKQH